MSIINNIQQLKDTAKVNASLEFDVIQPFLQEARDIYLVRYLGEDLILLLEKEDIPERAKELKKKVQLCLGPLALWLGNAELSVRIGDSGFTVEKRESANSGIGYVPASDTKIAKVEESLERRAFNYLDIVLEYLDVNSSIFPEWEKSRYFKLRYNNYILSALQFQETGMVDIDYSRLTFEQIRPAMSMIEKRFVFEVIGAALDKKLRNKLSADNFTPAEETLISYIRSFVACKTAEIHTSEKSKENRETSKKKEFRAIIRPIYSDITDTGNFFAEQSKYYYSKIVQTLNEFAEEFGITPFNPALEWNDENKKIITSFG